jgi:hypothetical protein
MIIGNKKSNRAFLSVDVRGGYEMWSPQLRINFDRMLLFRIFEKFAAAT